MAQLGNLIVNGVTRLLSKLYVSDSVTAPNFIGKLTGTAAKLGRNGDADTPMTFNWSGKDGQPTWLWGGENGSDMYVYNPSNFSVKNAKAAGSADSATKLSSSAGSATQPVYFSDGKPVATTYTLGKSVPASAVFTDTNTWRGVQNNLTSTATDQSLSAAQGKVLKDLVDGKAAASHTHTKSQITDFPALGTAAAKNVRTLTAQGASGWKDAATDQQYVPDMAFMAYWNGAYSGTASNLAYCSKGAFGTIVTKSTSDYAVAGHTHTWDSVTGKPSTFTPSSHTHGVIKSLSVNGTTITCTKDDGTTSTITTQDTNTTYGTFKGATTSEAGSTGLVIAPVAGNANRYLRSDGTWAVPANTWRGIQDNLTSTSTTDSLSANQGKVLKGLIDGKAPSSHTHNYAGSSSAGGAATSANKVNAALTINLNGTSQGAWDGSSAKSISITAASVGATSVTISRW